MRSRYISFILGIVCISMTFLNACGSEPESSRNETKISANEKENVSMENTIVYGIVSEIEIDAITIELYEKGQNETFEATGETQRIEISTDTSIGRLTIGKQSELAQVDESSISVDLITEEETYNVDAIENEEIQVVEENISEEIQVVEENTNTSIDSETGDNANTLENVGIPDKGEEIPLSDVIETQEEEITLLDISYEDHVKIYYGDNGIVERVIVLVDGFSSDS